ncbi:ubiquinol-cytochrome C chaperone family protein [Gimibacter soli]|uniref:Ubiquinol-cytochrome C chaperone family protein n=1 Tax=Gimibacter soli TaxID=3024400 RepID=A0AAE9XQ06_9PROT|nr:ubiquinol-cytochrome C chaperone family protein [Gimibacter soli]WCL52986.1 ubiquinol-cytochrome C chaperone family protein [Gimibacter soli]
MLKRWLNNRRLQISGYKLYGAVVDRARDPVYYTDHGVEDTVEGRFDMICLHLFILSCRLLAMGDRGQVLQRAAQEAMIADMDRSLREMGVGDLSVGKEVKKMGAAWFGRLAAYDMAVGSDAPLEALTDAIRRNVYREAETPHAAKLAAYVLAAIDALKNVSDEALSDAKLSLPAVGELVKD